MGYSMRTPAHSEATRLLCAGARLNAGFRQRVIDELLGHAERPVPPSLGVDVRPVLAHALQARRQEIQTALVLLAVWVAYLLVSVLLVWDTLDDRFGGDFDVSFDEVLALELSAGGGTYESAVGHPTSWVFFYAGIVLALWSGRALSGREALLYGGTKTQTALGPGLRRLLGKVVTYAARLAALVYWLSAVLTVGDNPYPVIFPMLMAVVVWLHRVRTTAVLREQLSRENFATAQQPGLPPGERYRRIDEAIHREQHAPATLYDANRPFVGLGVPIKPWSFALELRRKKEGTQSEPAAGVPQQGVHGAEQQPQVPTQHADSGQWDMPPLPMPSGQVDPVQPPHPDGPATGEFPQQPEYADGRSMQQPPHLSSRHVIDMITPKITALREATARTSRDSLRALEIEEFVYLPSGVRRDSGVYETENVHQHLAEAADDSGETRRHFLRIRVGSWQEQVVVSLLVRVHTQGGMLVLEVAPHVLGPVAEEFREVDAIVERRAGGAFREGVHAFLTAPAATAAAGVAAGRALLSVSRVWLSSPEDAAPDAPVISIRELASASELSLFQEMDVSRYIKTIQERITGGVRDALEQRGFRTDRFEQQIVNVQDGGIYIEDMSGGAVAIGEGGQAQHFEKSPA